MGWEYNFLITEENDSDDDSSEKAVNTLIALGEWGSFENVIIIAVQKHAVTVKKKHRILKCKLHTVDWIALLKCRWDK